MNKPLFTKALISGLAILFITSIACSQDKSLKEHIIFYSSFDGKTTADVSVGDPQIYTAESYKKVHTAKTGLHSPSVELAKGKGLTGDALHFKTQNKSALFYKGYKNAGYSAKSWSGAISFWLSLDPNKDLAPGYCDPINVTDVSYNDAALWIDFTDDNPREFRLGALGDLAVWNPENKNDSTKWEIRTVTVKEPPFDHGKWTHIVLSYSEINTHNSICELYLNGQLQGAVKDVNDPFTWEEENAKIMLGLGYIGMMDELSVFDKTLNAEEVRFIYELKGGLKTLLEE